jgi:hypothetical protein
MTLSTIPDMLTLGCTGIRAVSKIQFRYSCGSSHSRLCHFLLDAGTCRVAGICLTLLMRHALIMTVERESIQFRFAHFEYQLLRSCCITPIRPNGINELARLCNTL